MGGDLVAAIYSMKMGNMKNHTIQELPANIDWEPLLFNLKKQKLVPFLGAGASLGFDGAPGLPSSSTLAETLTQECGYPGSDTRDFLRVAQYYALKFGELRLRESVHEQLSPAQAKPGEVHRILAGWPIKVVLTTNYDHLMERAFSKRDKDPAKALYKRRGDQEQIKTPPSVDKPLVYKLHGSLDDVDSMVITEDNYIDFLISLIEGNPKLPDAISAIFRTDSILFIGYGLKDWNIRVLLRYFRKDDDIRSFAVQRDLRVAANEAASREWESMVLYWERKNISVYNCDALAFLRELDRRYQEGLRHV
jgi:NAD-dependent SIR2 family protein deacetylase